MVSLWEDKEVRFDIPFSDMRPRTGEKLIDRLDNVEDTKGNAGDRAIGYDTILTINTRIINSRTPHPTRALHLMTASDNARFEFIFTNLVAVDKRHFTSVMDVHRAYLSSKPYRELKLRSVVVRQNRLKVLPLEQIFETLYGVWNLSTDQGSLGTFVITNVRLVWFADTNEGFNVSLPYLQVDSIKMCNSKFGFALVVTSSEESGSFVLGFKVDPEEKMREVFKKLTSVHSVYINNPIFGVEYVWNNKTSRINPSGSNEDFIIDGVETLEDKGIAINELSAYLAEESKGGDAPVYNPDLGLAIQRIKDGYTISKLWEVSSS